MAAMESRLSQRRPRRCFRISGRGGTPRMVSRLSATASRSSRRFTRSIFPLPMPCSVCSCAILPAYDAQGGFTMPHSNQANHTYKLVEIVGTSPESFAQAVRNGVEKAAKSLRHLDWFEVSEMRGRIADGQVAQYQVKMKVGFRLDE